MSIDYKAYKEDEVSLTHELQLLGSAHETDNFELHLYKDIILYLNSIGDLVDSSTRYTSDKEIKTEQVSFQTREGIFVKINGSFRHDRIMGHYIPVDFKAELISFNGGLENFKADLEDKIRESCRKYVNLRSSRN